MVEYSYIKSKFESPVFLITFVILLISLYLGVKISNTANNTEKSITDENSEFSSFGWTLIILSSILILLVFAGIVYLYTNPITIMIAMNYKFTIGTVVAILTTLLIVGSIIISIDNNPRLDDETKNDMYSSIGQWFTTITASAIVFAIFS